MDSFEKQPAEAYVIAIEWAGKLPPNTSLNTCQVNAVRFPDATDDASVLSYDIAMVSGTQTLTQVKAGQHGCDYRITFLATLSNGDILEEDVLMQVREQ